MARILHFRTDEPTLARFAEVHRNELETVEAESAFEAILAIACRLVDRARERMPQPERRVSRRRSVAHRAECSGPWGTSPCMISDMSETGMSLVCGRKLLVGEQVKIKWQNAPDAKPAEIRCVVRYSLDTVTGVEFVRITDTQRVPVYAALGIAEAKPATMAAAVGM